MSTPDSVHPVLLLPRIPRSVAHRTGALASLEALPPVLVASAGLVILQTVSFISTRMLAVSYSSTLYTDTRSTEIVLGAISFMSIVLVAGALVLGHRALEATEDSSVVSRQVAAIVLGAAYLHLIIWGTRIVAAAFAASSSGASGAFLPNVFWWG
jgi:hypothetical protein